MDKISKTEAKSRLLTILTRHVGQEKAIGMGELYERVYGKSWRHRINDTRPVRYLITELRNGGALIGDIRTPTGAGYYLARSVHELKMFFDRRKHEAVKKLDMIARMQHIGLPELLGQMQLNLREGAHGRNLEGEEQRGQ
jgi:hypothetical protein